MGNILVTGGTGYIGSHTTIELIKNGYKVIIVDDLSNSKIDVLDSIEEITGVRPKFIEGNICDKTLVETIFNNNPIDAVIHFAGFKAVGESVAIPLAYYQNNLVSTLNLCELMAKHKCKKFVFSSSATVYGEPSTVPILENFPRSAASPYGNTKLVIEHILEDLYHSDDEWSISLLRYFNPIGAHESGLIGENPNGIPNNLMPFIVKVAAGQLECLSVFGNDYNTIDGTGVRDYVHVVDLAKGHVLAIKKILNETGINIYNLGTGKGSSVLEVINTFSRVNNITVNYKIAERRSGDIASCYADTHKAEKELGFKAEKTLDDMCRDNWLYAKKNL
ncbi:MAG: UDP-glucose 4-epimerase GalE [Filifactoraceae bacterium]